MHENYQMILQELEVCSFNFVYYIIIFYYKSLAVPRYNIPCACNLTLFIMQLVTTPSPMGVVFKYLPICT